MLATVLVPTTSLGGRKSTIGRRAVLLNSASMAMPMPTAMAPPRYSPWREMTSKLMVVPRSTITHGPPYL